jgi:hypothetical protein
MGLLVEIVQANLCFARKNYFAGQKLDLLANRGVCVAFPLSAGWAIIVPLKFLG